MIFGVNLHLICGSPVGVYRQGKRLRPRGGAPSASSIRFAIHPTGKPKFSLWKVGKVLRPTHEPTLTHASLVPGFAWLGRCEQPTARLRIATPPTATHSHPHHRSTGRRSRCCPLTGHWPSPPALAPPAIPSCHDGPSSQQLPPRPWPCPASCQPLAARPIAQLSSARCYPSQLQLPLYIHLPSSATGAAHCSRSFDARCFRTARVRAPGVRWRPSSPSSSSSTAGSGVSRCARTIAATAHASC